VTRRVVRKPRARRDLLEHFVYIGENASVEDAERFLGAAEAAFEQLAKRSAMGVRRDYYHKPGLAGIRMWPISGFDKYLVFYRPTEQGIDVIRVLHGARDLKRLFDEEE
jgi:toxin ParE1/3/4